MVVPIWDAMSLYGPVQLEVQVEDFTSDGFSKCMCTCMCVCVCVCVFL